MTEQTERTLLQLGDAFRQFSRHGRWGTCGHCPRDLQRNAYPEFCVNTSRYDHHLTATELGSAWERYFRSNAPLNEGDDPIRIEAKQR